MLETIGNLQRLAEMNQEVTYLEAQAYHYVFRVKAAAGDNEAAEKGREHALMVLERAFNVKIDSVKLRMLHLGLLQNRKPTAQTLAKVKASANRLIRLSREDDQWALIAAGKAYSVVGQHELAVEILQQAKNAFNAARKSFPEDARLILIESAAATERP